MKFSKKTSSKWGLPRIGYLLKLPFKRSKQINASEARSMINEGNVIIIDARKSEDYQESHIEGALSMEDDTLNNFIDQTDRSNNIICYCYMGISSKGLCSKLTRAGFKNVYNLIGGYTAWRKK